MPVEGTLLLSPHADDAAFSLGGAIAAGLLPRPITLLTVFGRSTFSQATGPHGDVDAVTQQRRAEDEAYARRHGLQWIWLEHDDAVVRLGWDAIFRGDAPRPDHTHAIIAAAREVGAALVLAPLGLGNHVDHRLLRDLAIEMTHTEGLAFYEDLPYAATLSPNRIATHVQAFDPALQPIELPLDPAALEAKRADVETYASQVDFRIRRSLRRHARTGRERLWSRANWKQA